MKEGVTGRTETEFCGGREIFRKNYFLNDR